MAESRSVRQNDVVCRFFMSSFCRDGDSCLFLHDATRAPTTVDNVCRYYLQGRCVFGNDCRYDHVQVNNLGNYVAHLHNDRHSAGPSRHSTNMDTSCNNTRSSFFSQDHARHSAGPVCRYYLQGKCVYGENCRYDHVRVNNDVNSNSQSHNGYHSAGHSRDTIYLGASSNDTRCKPNNQNTHQTKRQNTKEKKNIPQVKKKVQSEKDLEKDMALAIAIQKSMDKTCGICMDVVVDKENFSERKFGILDKCNHVYCFSCIGQWRKSKERSDHSLNSDVTKACPECRIVSDLVIPSEYFVDTLEEKEKLISDYKKASCLKRGNGTITFWESSSSLPANRDRTTVEHPLPIELIEDDDDVDDELDSIFGDGDGFGYTFVNDLYCVEWDYLDSDD